MDKIDSNMLESTIDSLIRGIIENVHTYIPSIHLKRALCTIYVPSEFLYPDFLVSGLKKKVQLSGSHLKSKCLAIEFH